MASTDKLIRIILKLEDQTSKQLNSVAGQLDKVGQKMQSVGKTMTAAITLPIVAAGTAGVKMAMDLDQAMKNIQSVGKQTNEEIAALSDTFIEMSTDITKTTDSAQALAEAFYDIQGSGFEGADAMKVLEAATMAATAGLTDTHTAAQGVTAVLNAYGMEAEQAAHISDLMFATVDRGVGSFEELVTSMSNVVPAASAMGIQYEEISAAVATMSKQGQSFANATTNLNGVITAFLKPTDAMKKAINDLGYESAQAMLDTLGLGGAMQALDKYTGGSAEAMGELFGDVRAMRGAFALTGEGARMFSEDLQAMADATGRTAESFATQTESFAAQWKNFQNVLNALLIEVGQVIIPVLSDLLQNYVIPAIQWFRQLPDPIKQGVVAFAALAAAIGPLLIVIGSIISAISTIGGAFTAISGAFAVLTPLLGGVIGAFTTLGGILITFAAPILIAIAAIAALIAIIAVLWANREKIAEWAQKAWEGMQKFGEAVKVGFEKTVEFTGNGLAAWEGNFKMMGVIAQKSGQSIGESFQKIAHNVIESFKKVAPVMLDIGKAILQGLIDGVKSKIDGFIKMVVDLANKVAESVKSALKIKSPSQVFAGIGENVVAGFNKGIANMGGLGVNVNGTSLGSGGNPSLATAGAGGGGSGNIYVNGAKIMPPTREMYEWFARELAKDAFRNGANGDR